MIETNPLKGYATIAGLSVAIQIVSSIVIAALGLSSSSSVFLGDLPDSVVIAIHVILCLSVVIFSPILEEFIFRKLLWALFEKVSARVALVTTSILFSAIHIDPVTVVGLLPISFFLGWLRLKTGGLRAPILSHCLYNFTGLVIILAT